MVGDYMSTSFTGDGKAHPVFAMAKPPTGSVFSQRAATATFDLTALQIGPRVRTERSRVYRSTSSGHRRSPQRKLGEGARTQRSGGRSLRWPLPRPPRRREWLGGNRARDADQQRPVYEPDSQHATQVEPDSFGFGNTVVVTIQTGRYVNGGGSNNIAWATSTDAGRHWATGTLPGTTGFAGGPWARISDPSVAYDPQHDVWMISTLNLRTASTPFGSPSAVRTSRSTDGGLTWQRPVTTSFGATSTTRTGSPATRGRRASTTGTATRSGTTSAMAADC